MGMTAARFIDLISRIGVRDVAAEDAELTEPDVPVQR
jgi:hypothetical protein